MQESGLPFAPCVFHVSLLLKTQTYATKQQASKFPPDFLAARFGLSHPFCSSFDFLLRLNAPEAHSLTLAPQQLRA
jgi:hypothetical protein